MNKTSKNGNQTFKTLKNARLSHLKSELQEQSFFQRSEVLDSAQ